MLKLEDYIRLYAETRADSIAIVSKDDKVSFKQLLTRVEEKICELRKIGVRHQQCYVFKSSQDIDFVSTYLAIHSIGAVAVPLEESAPIELVNEISDYLSHQVIPEDVADILFTTGTTGKSKGVMISNTTIVANAENLIDAMGFSSETMFIICGPLNHIASLSKLYTVFISGGCVNILNGMKDMNAFYSALDFPFSKIATFLVPAMIRMLLIFSSNKLSEYSDKIDFIETGAAPMAHSDMLKLCELLPHTRLYNTYASTETGIISTYNYNDGLCMAGCLGQPMKHAQFFITEDGRIACRGKTLMRGYVGDAEATARILYENTLFTADSGYIDDKGRLYIKGRLDDVINVGGFKIDPVEIENVALSMDGIKDCICISAEHPVIGTTLELLVVINDEETFSPKAIASYMSTRLESYKIPQMYHVVDKIERTFNGKLNRKFYRIGQRKV